MVIRERSLGDWRLSRTKSDTGTAYNNYLSNIDKRLGKKVKMDVDKKRKKLFKLLDKIGNILLNRVILLCESHYVKYITCLCLRMSVQSTLVSITHCSN